METMTIERLRQFRGIMKEVEEMEREINTLYYPISSPNGRAEGRGTMPSDPTAQSFYKIQRLSERLEKRRQTLADELEAIEAWCDTLEDHELRAIIRAHYLLGDSWRRCTQRILNYDYTDSAKFRVYRYFGLVNRNKCTE